MTTTTGNQSLTRADGIPTLIVALITVWATVTSHLLIAVPGVVLSTVMIAVTLHPRRTLRSLARVRR